MKKCQKTFGNRKSRGLPGAEAQNGECCAWISTGCLKAKKAFASKALKDIPEDYCGYAARASSRKGFNA